MTRSRCRYTVGDTNDIVTVEAGLEFVRHDAAQVALEAARIAVRTCDTRQTDTVVTAAAAAATAIAAAPGSGASSSAVVALEAHCVREKLGEWLEARRDELDFEWAVYRNLKRGLTGYGCGMGGNGEEEGGADGSSSTAVAVGGDGGVDGGDRVCLNLDPVINEGESELGRHLAKKGDVATKRLPAAAVTGKAMDKCLALLAAANQEAALAAPGEAAAAKAAAEMAAAKAAAEAEAAWSPLAGLLSGGASGASGGVSSGGYLSKLLSGAKAAVGGAAKAVTVATNAAVGEEDEQNTAFWEGLDEVPEAPLGVVLSTKGGAGGGEEEEEARALPSLLPRGAELAQCLADHGLASDYTAVSREVSRVRNAKGKLAEPLRNQTCRDDGVGTVAVPEDDRTFSWTAPVADDYSGDYDATTGTTGTVAGATAGTGGGGDDSKAVAAGPSGRARSVRQLLRRNGASVLLIDDFVTDEECAFMMEAATPGLRRSTVNEEGNNQAVSSYRNSQAANVMANWRNKSDPVARVVRRVFAFANDHTGYGLTVDGQEPFSVIQYNQGQEYRPHCDGSCDGSPHLHAGRVATMLMYCATASKGGGTSFTKAGVHVKPTNGQAVFFSYRGENGTMDVELTEHSGCPVVEGTKWVVTQWLRSGVGKGESWTKFDPIGGRL